MSNKSIGISYGDVTKEYEMESLPSVPSGGGYKWELLEKIVLTENVASVSINLPLEYSAFSIVFKGTLVSESNATLDMRFNNNSDLRPQFSNALQFRDLRPTHVSVERRGKMFPIVRVATHNGATVVAVNEYLTAHFWDAWWNFTYVRCYATGNEFASGYEIHVYGVRA